MSTEKMREDFEAWLASYESRREKNGWMPLEASIHVRMYEAWQASRAAIEVELPPAPDAPEEPEEAIDDSHMDAYHSAIGMRHACSQFIKAAGLRVKP